MSRTKKDKDAQGRLGLRWTKDEWGNWLADRFAAHDLMSIQRQGIRYHMLKVPAKDIYGHLGYQGQCYIGDILGCKVGQTSYSNMHSERG